VASLCVNLTAFFAIPARNEATITPSEYLGCGCLRTRHLAIPHPCIIEACVVAGRASACNSQRVMSYGRPGHPPRRDSTGRGGRFEFATPLQPRAVNAHTQVIPENPRTSLRLPQRLVILPAPGPSVPAYLPSPSASITRSEPVTALG
jgi:hypothetical protein